MQYHEFKEFISNIKLLDKTYDIIRIVDPLHKKVLNLNHNDITELELRCNDFWSNKKVCENCVSMRAYNENRTFFKIEYNYDKIYMITAIPHEFNGRKVIIELLKDATDCLLIETVGGNVNIDVEDNQKMD